MIPTRTPAFSSRLMPTNDRPAVELCPLLLEDYWVFSELAKRHGSSAEGITVPAGEVGAGVRSRCFRRGLTRVQDTGGCSLALECFMAWDVWYRPP